MILASRRLTLLASTFLPLVLVQAAQAEPADNSPGLVQLAQMGTAPPAPAAPATTEADDPRKPRREGGGGGREGGGAGGAGGRPAATPPATQAPAGAPAAREERRGAPPARETPPPAARQAPDPAPPASTRDTTTTPDPRRERAQERREERQEERRGPAGSPAEQRRDPPPAARQAPDTPPAAGGRDAPADTPASLRERLQREQRQDDRRDAPAARQPAESPAAIRERLQRDQRQDQRPDDRRDAIERRQDQRQDERQDDRRDAIERRQDLRQDQRQDQRRDSREERQDDRRDAKRFEELRQERRETMEDGRRVIRESDRRAIIREGDRTFIRHDESDRFRRLGPNVRVERRGRETITIVPRPGGVEIVTVVDEDGRLIRRFRRERGREVVLIDNRFRGPGRQTDFVVGLPPPVISIPRERYVIDNRASRRDYVQLFRAPPVERIERRYTLDEVRYSPNLRARMPRVDVDEINFELGSWEIPPSQYGVLEEIAQAMNEVIRDNPNEVFLIEGHTDATGTDEDNLSLSDRRAESVANVLTDEFKVPPENLTTQGYGESQLKVNTEGPERANRRVVLLRITPLIASTAQAAPRTEPIPRAR